MRCAKVFGLLNATDAKDKRTYGVDSWLMGNREQEYCIYNKVEELKRNNIGIEEAPAVLSIKGKQILV